MAWGDDLRIEHEYKDKDGDILKIGSFRGKWGFLSDGKKEDRVYFLQINDSAKFIIKHEHQIQLLKLVLDNDIIQRRLEENADKFKAAIDEILAKRRGNDGA